MKTMYKFSLILLGAVLLLSLPLPAGAQEGGFSETFDDADLPGWELHPQQAQVREGSLVLAPEGFAMFFAPWSLTSLSVRVRLGEANEAVISYHMGEAGRYRLLVSGGRLALEKDGEGGGLLGEALGLALAADTWYTLEVRISAGEHAVLVDDVEQFTASDPAPLTQGALRLSMHGEGEVAFDDLQAQGSAMGAPLPPGEGEPQPPGEGEPVPAGETAPLVGEGAGATAEPAATQDGGRNNLITEFFASQASTIELTTFLINLLLAAVCAYILSIVYTHWGSSLTNRRKFGANFLLMTVTTTFIIMVVRSSIALSLGLVGALSIVRFRAAVKEPEELAYLFFALGIGIGLGDNQRMITLIAMAAGIVLLGLRHLLRKPAQDINMHVQVASRNPAEVGLAQLNETLGRHCAKVKLIRFDETASALEAGYLVELRHAGQLEALRLALKEAAPGLEITFLDNKGIW